MLRDEQKKQQHCAANCEWFTSEKSNEKKKKEKHKKLDGNVNESNLNICKQNPNEKRCKTD